MLTAAIAASALCVVSPRSAEAGPDACVVGPMNIHRLLGKTGSKRQSDLVKLVSGFAGSVVRSRAS